MYRVPGVINFQEDEDLKGESPPQGDLAWLWFKPVDRLGGYGQSLFAAYHPQCARCQVFGVKDIYAKLKRCWSCGRFVSGPKLTHPRTTMLF